MMLSVLPILIPVLSHIPARSQSLWPPLDAVDWPTKQLTVTDQLRYVTLRVFVRFLPLSPPLSDDVTQHHVTKNSNRTYR